MLLDPVKSSHGWLEQITYSVERLALDALSLSTSERAELAHRLLLSLDESHDEEAEAAAVHEALRRSDGDRSRSCSPRPAGRGRGAVAGPTPALKLSLHPEAEADVAEAITFYEGRTVGLGSDFLGEVLEAFERIESTPEAWPVIASRYAGAWSSHFPTACTTGSNPEDIFVLAVTHGRRKPEGWRSRT